MNTSAQPVLATTGLRFRYGPGDDWLINSISVEFPTTSISVVTGRSGSGKSTLLSLLGLLLTPTSGHLTISGRHTETMSDYARSRLRGTHVGFLFQDALLDPTRTVLDNITEGALFAGLSPRGLRSSASDLLRQVDLDIDLLSERLPATISGGQAQRVALCRALIKKPVIVLADEPTGNLDTDSSRIVMDVLSRTADSGAAIIIATHDEAITGYATQVISLD